MIDPRFANAGAVPFAAGYGAQQVPFYQHRQRHHHHRKNKHGGLGDSPVSRDESIHKVDHGHHQHHQHFQQNEGAQFGGGYGVPYGVAGFHQQQQFGGGNYGYGNQYQGNVYDQGQFAGGVGAPVVKHRRRHHRHRQHGAEAQDGTGAVDQAQGVPEQLIGQRSSSVLGRDKPQVHSPQPPAEGFGRGEQGSHRRHRHHHHHHSSEQASYGQAHQSRQGHSSAGADGYGHINDELIFIERGEHSPHRQEPPPGYEYKGKIEVQSIDKEQRSQSQGQSFVLPQAQSVAPPQGLGPCPPGWQQMVLSAAPGGPCPPGVPCPPGGTMYAGQLAGPAGLGQAGLGGIGSFGGSPGGIGFGGVGPVGAAGSGGGLDNLAASLPFPPQGQLIADYIVESNAGGVSSSGGSGFATDFQQTTGAAAGGASFGEQQAHTSSRATIIEVWQKRSKTETHEKVRSRSRSPKTGPSFDFDRFRNEILAAIERMTQPGGSRIQWTGHDGGTQTQIHPSYEEKKETERRPTGGEVRVIVQPIQPVFYMPRQNETTAGPQIGPGPAIQQPSGAPHVVYVPRNVYVPVIKPVFVPRERVIVRPQVIHVARPVLVDRPVPVTQRPIIIDRERPVPVPVRGAAQAAQGGGARTAREEYVYRDNLPVAYGGRCAEYAGGANYGYMPSQQEHQYATSSTHEIADGYQTQAPIINGGGPEQFQHSHSTSQLDVQQGAGSFHGSYTNLARTNSASAVNVAPLHCTEPIDVLNLTVNSTNQRSGAPIDVFNTNVNSAYQRSGGPIEILDATVNPNWQRTDKTSLVRRYGRPAYDIVQRTDQVEQQMYQELRQRSSSGGIQRSVSGASYGSGSGVVINGGGGDFVGGAGSYSSLGDIHNLNQEGIHYQGSGSQPVCVNY